MTETERLRELLDERGVEWRRTPHYSSESIDNETVFRGEGIEWIANGHLNGHIGLRALRYEVTPEQAVEATLGPRKQPPHDELIESLRRDCDIDASWDGLRRFWSIGLTEDGCLMRDRACKAETENAKLRELVADMWNEGMCECGSRGKCASCEYDYPTRMRELRIEVDE